MTTNWFHKKARRLKTIAKEINETCAGLTARVERSFCSTDRKIDRLRWPGKGRWGNRIIVVCNGEVVLDHNSAETYRCNAEVEEWLECWKEEHEQ